MTLRLIELGEGPECPDCGLSLEWCWRCQSCACGCYCILPATGSKFVLWHDEQFQNTRGRPVRTVTPREVYL